MTIRIRHVTRKWQEKMSDGAVVVRTTYQFELSRPDGSEMTLDEVGQVPSQFFPDSVRCKADALAFARQMGIPCEP